MAGKTWPEPRGTRDPFTWIRSPVRSYVFYFELRPDHGQSSIDPDSTQDESVQPTSTRHMPLIDTDGACAKLRDQERPAQRGNILQKQDLLYESSMGIAQPPKCMNPQGDGNKKGDQRPRSPSRLIPESNAEPSGQT